MECISIILHPRNASFHKRFKKLPGKPIEFQPSKRQRVHIIDILHLKLTIERNEVLLLLLRSSFIRFIVTDRS